MSSAALADTLLNSQEACSAPTGAEEPPPLQPGNSTRRSVSFSVLMQIFIFTSLAVIVVAILLIFKLYVVVEVEKVAARYLDATGEIVQRMVQASLEHAVEAAFYAAAGGNVTDLVSWTSDMQWRCQSIQYANFGFVAAYVVFRSGLAVGCNSSSDCWVVHACSYNPKVLCRRSTIPAVAAERPNAPNTYPSPQMYNPQSASPLQYATTQHPNGTLAAVLLFAPLFFPMENESDGVFVGVLATQAVQDVLNTVYADENSEGIEAYLREEQTGRVLVSSQNYVQSDEPLLSRSIQLSNNTPTWSVVIQATHSVVSDLERGTYVVVVVSLSVAIAVSIASIMVIRIALAPLAVLREQLDALARLRFNCGISESQQHSFIREIDMMFRSFFILADTLRGYRTVLAECGDAGGADSVVATGELPRVEEEEEGKKHVIPVTLTYVSRKRGLVKRTVTFGHTYVDGDENLYFNFVADCLKNVQENKYEVVAIHVLTQSRKVVISGSRQLEEAISTCPGELQATMRKSATRTLLSPVSLLVDLLNLLLNIAFISTVLAAAPTKSARLSMYVFLGLYSFTIFVNVAISLWLLKRAQRDHVTMEWLGQAGVEVSVLLLLCSVNTQHIHFLWSHWNLGGLRFNCPRDIWLWSKAVQWSYFGFVFGDLMQLAYKFFLLYSSEDLASLTTASLLMSATSIGLALPKKISFFTLSRKADSQGEEDAPSRQRTGNVATLTAQSTTALMVALHDIASHTQLRIAAECSAFYSNVFALVKSSEGTVLYFHSGVVLAAFNAPKPTHHYNEKALLCALQCVDTMQQSFNVRVTAALLCDLVPVGMLGSSTQKNFECLVSEQLLQRMMRFGIAGGIPVLATPPCAALAGPSFRVFPHAVASGDGPYYEVRLKYAASRGKTRVPCWVRALSPFGVLTEEKEFLQRVNDLASGIIHNDGSMPFDETVSGTISGAMGEANAVSTIFGQDYQVPEDEPRQGGDDGALLMVPIQRTAAFVLRGMRPVKKN